MRMYDLIYAKKSGLALGAGEIAWWVRGVSGGTIPDEQSAALLMAICWRGMSVEETMALTLAMRDSGRTMDLSGVPGVKMDKHSTGGVGDKTTLVIGPIVACCGRGHGISCAMLSGRSLGHTGGTIDKLASIPGMRVELSESEFLECLGNVGFANSAQTEEICPADRRLYALRDISATVESMPLIAASVMSKKLAGGADALLLDVKCGTGAFMKTRADAEALAGLMAAVGRGHGMKVKALITPMDEPLGCAIGNALEVMEAVEILRGQRLDGHLAKLCIELAAEMLVLGGAAKDACAAAEMALASIRSGRALEAFKEYVAFCGGDTGALDDFARLPKAPVPVDVPSPRSGTIESIDSRALGVFAMSVGAGRRRLTDALDYGAGISVRVAKGDTVEKGQPLFTVHCRDASMVNLDEILASVRFSLQ